MNKSSYMIDNKINDINSNLFREVVRLTSYVFVEEGYFKPDDAHNLSKAREQALVLRMATSIMDIFTNAIGTEERECEFNFNKPCELSYDKDKKIMTLKQSKLTYKATIKSFKVRDTDYEIIDEIDGFVYSMLEGVKFVEESTKTHGTVVRSYFGTNAIDKKGILDYLISVKTCLDKAIKNKI